MTGPVYVCHGIAGNPLFRNVRVDDQKIGRENWTEEPFSCVAIDR